MELYTAEVNQIKKQIDDWLIHPDRELECTFGGGSVDATTFFAVAQRLRSKGFRELSQEDRLTVTTPSHVRFTIQGLGVIQQYCRDNILAGKPFVAMIKDKASLDGEVDLDDYGVRVKTRREVSLSRNDPRISDLFAAWQDQLKAFRMIRRWSFEEDGLRYDLSIVRSTLKDSRGSYKWVKKFTDQNLSSHPYTYEIEVELLRRSEDTGESAMKRIIKGTGEILRGIQKSVLLLRKSKKEKILQAYGFPRFLGCSSVTLEDRNFSTVKDTIPNIRSGYNVTDKADGLRCLAITDKKGELYLVDMGLNVYRTGLQNEKCRDSIIDGEWVTRTRSKEPIQQFLAFDIYYAKDKKDVSQYPFYTEDKTNYDTRYNYLKGWIENFNSDGPKKLLPYLTAQVQLQVAMKKFLFAKAGDLSIFNKAANVLDTHRVYYTDGLIFTPNSLPLPGYNKERGTLKPGATFYDQFKWKPSEDNTIDFLVRFEKLSDSPTKDLITIGVKPDTHETIRYKTMRLYVGSSKPKAYNPRDMILFERKYEDPSDRQEYRAVPFYPNDYYDTMASVSYGTINIDNATNEEYISTEHNNEPIQDTSIVEMRYDPSKPRGWRWIPLRIRHDKTERLQKGTLARTLNSEEVANSVWNSIHNPITESMIRSGSSLPTLKESLETLEKIEERDTMSLTYFKRTGQVKDEGFVRGLREFHNHYIKEVILYNRCLKGESKKLIDIACGKGSDIRRWAQANVSFVLGVDNAGDNITNTEDGAYSRYIEHTRRNRGKPLAPMVFVVGDSKKRYSDGEAGATDEERDILRSVFGKHKPLGPIPPYVDKVGAGELSNGADAMTCMFALHYFFENRSTLNGLLHNISSSLKIGGYFFGCCFDGNSVFNFLKNVEYGSSITGREKTSQLWSIRKEYSAEELVPNEESLGLKISVDFISIGSTHSEYLVSFPYFVERMKDYGLTLLTSNECSSIGLENSSELFSKTYETTDNKYNMSKVVKDFSFLNRWFIFCKRNDYVAETSSTGSEIALAEEQPLSDTTSKSFRDANPSADAKSLDYANLSTDAKSVAYKESLANVIPMADAKSVAYKESLAAEAMLPEESTKAIQQIPSRNVERALVSKVESMDPLARSVVVTEKEAVPLGKTYAKNEVYQFYIGAALEDKLKIKDPGAARWLAPSARYIITDDGVSYPSLEHYLAGMMYKHATNKPELAEKIFSRNGSIHLGYTRKRLEESQGETKTISEKRDFELIKEESHDVKDAISQKAFKQYGAVFNESQYAIQKDTLLKTAVSQRYKGDERLRKILSAARNNNKYLLYFTYGSISDLGGMHKSDGTIMGDNKLGKLYMELSGY